MKLEFSSLDFGRIGASTNTSDAMWSQMELRLLDIEERRFLPVLLTLPVPKRPDVTLAELRTVAFGRAKEVLREALRCLEDNDLEQLEKLEEERKDRCFELENESAG